MNKAIRFGLTAVMLLPAMAMAEEVSATESLISFSNFLKVFIGILPLVGVIWGIIDMWSGFGEWKKGAKAGWQANGPQKGQCIEMVLIGVGKAFAGAIIFFIAFQMGLYTFQKKFLDEVEEMGPEETASVIYQPGKPGSWTNTLNG